MGAVSPGSVLGMHLHLVANQTDRALLGLHNSR